MARRLSAGAPCDGAGREGRFGMTLSFSETAAPWLSAAAGSEHEQRREGRAHAVYLPCCIRSALCCGAGLIRNISPGGLMVETQIDGEPGSQIDYFLDSAQWRRARIVWREGSRCGLQNLDEEAKPSPGLPPRSIRIPTSLVGRLWLHERAIEVGIGNISNRGVLAFGVPPIPRGQLVTLSLAGRQLANTSLRWWADGSAGLRFESPMTLRALTELLERAGRDGSGFYYERRLGDLLEVVAANDPRG